MKLIRLSLLCGALAVGAASLSPAPVAALPLGSAGAGGALASQAGDASPVIQVRRRGSRGAIGAGIVGGMILGGIIASQARPYYYYDYPPPYRVYRPYPAYRAYPAYDPDIAYCMRRFRSYDPYSMTYLGYDGLRHPCP